MFKRFIVSLTALIVFCGFAPSAELHAAGGTPLAELTTSSSSAATGASVTFTAYRYTNTCSNGSHTSESTCNDGQPPIGHYPLAGEPLEIYILSGDGVVVGGANGTGNGASITTGSDGKASFTISSAVAGSKKIGVGYYGKSYTDKTVTFTAPAPAQPKPKPTPTSTPAPAPTPEPTPPEAPKAAAIEIQGQAVGAGETIKVEPNDSLVLKGKTVANGVVKLFIFSDPVEATVTADAEGNWTYEVAGLAPGEHHVEAEVTDPATKKTSARATLAAFTVNAAKTPPTTPATSAGTNSMPLIAGGAVLALVLIGAAGWWLRRRKQHNPLNHQAPVTAEHVEPVNSESDQKIDGKRL